MGTAPTLATIVVNGWELAVFCGRCREVRPVDAVGLGLRLDEHRPLSAWRFRCWRCGGAGEPWVTAPGNALMGHARIWPP